MKVVKARRACLALRIINFEQSCLPHMASWNSFRPRAGDCRMPTCRFELHIWRLSAPPKVVPKRESKGMSLERKTPCTTNGNSSLTRHAFTP